MNSDGSCADGGSHQMEEGKLMDARFQPDNPRSKFMPGSLLLSAAICRKCGVVALKGDTERLRDILPK